MDRYFGSDPDVVIAHFRNQEPEWFTHAERVASYAAGVLHRLQVHRGDVRKLLASLLFQRVVAGFEAMLILTERGMHTQGLVQRRSILEALFVLGAIWQKPEFVDHFLRADDERVFQIYKKIKRLPVEVSAALAPEFTLEVVDAKIAQLKAKPNGPKPKSVADYAEAADLLTWYLTDYSISSEAAHHVAKDLERHIHLDMDGDVNGMEWGPENIAPSELLSVAIDFVLMACYATESLFRIGPSDALTELQAQTIRLVGSDEPG